MDPIPQAEARHDFRALGAPSAQRVTAETSHTQLPGATRGSVGDTIAFVFLVTLPAVGGPARPGRERMHHHRGAQWALCRGGDGDGRSAQRLTRLRDASRPQDQEGSPNTMV